MTQERIVETGFPGGPLTRARIAESLRKGPPELPEGRRATRPAAVLFPIVEREELCALFTRRTEHLSSHAGQICFPGGRFHVDDESLIRTALREMEEEIGLSPAKVEIAGFLDPHETQNTGFMILPVVGFVPPDLQLTINPGEVAEVFEAPLSYILEPRHQVLKTAERGGVVREFYAIDYGGHTIWGATAAMIVNLSERLGLR